MFILSYLQLPVLTEEVHHASTSISQPAYVCSTALVVKEQIVSLENQFSDLGMKLILMLTMLERKSDSFVDEVRAAVLTIPLRLKKQLPFLTSHRRKILRASTVSEIMDILCSYWDYLNVSLFEYMVMKFGEEEIKGQLKMYLECLKDFRQKTKLGDFIDALGEEDRESLPQEFVEVQMKLGSSWEDRTLEDAEQFRLKQCRRAQIASYGLYFTGGRRKCIILTWGVAEMAVSSLLAVLDDPEQRECDILAIDYNATVAVLNNLPIAKHTVKTEEIGKKSVLLAVNFQMKLNSYSSQDWPVVPLSPIPTGMFLFLYNGSCYRPRYSDQLHGM